MFNLFKLNHLNHGKHRCLSFTRSVSLYFTFKIIFIIDLLALFKDSKVQVFAKFLEILDDHSLLCGINKHDHSLLSLWQ